MFNFLTAVDKLPYSTIPNVPGSVIPESAMIAFFASYVVFIMIILVILYVVHAITLVKIAQKTKTANVWFAWVPFLHQILMFNVAKMSPWWILIFFIAILPIIGPILLTIFLVYLWMRICRACKKPDYLGLFSIIPLIGPLVLSLYLAFAE